MTQSLTERLQERLATQSAEIEALTASELRQLGERLTSESQAALASMRSALHESITETTGPLQRDLERLRGIGRWWWSALALTWLMLAGLTGLLLWLWMGMSGMGSATTGASDTEPYPTFRQEGRRYMVLPEGAQATTCRQGERVRPCVVLPTLEMMLGSANGAATTMGGTAEEPTGAPSVRPPTRPDGS
jgi:hypothetical protein